jgi:hypothetical protein
MHNGRLKQFMNNTYNFTLWLFATGYTAFVALILITWIIRPPRWPRFSPAKMWDPIDSGLFQLTQLDQQKKGKAWKPSGYVSQAALEDMRIHPRASRS